MDLHSAPADEPSPSPVSRETLKLLSGIGKPEPGPLVPDQFQLDATQRIKHCDVLVSAPTGSGKTWIAIEATRDFLSRGCGVWYATPLKALSNAKYEEFGGIFGPENVGILTGDRKENADAPIVVGTTEILRNQLYDAMHSGSDLGVDLVILDEAHYLGDPDRGVVWEEVLIYAPVSVRLLLLSATVSNAEDVAQWLTHIRGSFCEVIQTAVRPVPLHLLFGTPSGELFPFLRGKKLAPEILPFAQAQRRGKKSLRPGDSDVAQIIATLRRFDLLPTIVFLKSRADCDKALGRLEPSPLSPEDGGFSEAVQSQLAPFPELGAQKQLDRLLMCRAGSHHAGQLPAWRLLVEKMMTMGHLEAILSTSTVAAGVNFPARTVVIVQSDRFDGRVFKDMTATELHQMTGRAGRRGMDNAGFALFVPWKHLDVNLIGELALAKPEPLRSKIAINFSMALNLLLSHDPGGVEELLRLSFAAFSEKPKKAAKIHTRLVNEFRRHLAVLKELGYVDQEGKPTYDGRWAAQLRLDHPLLIAELIREGEFDGLEPDELAGVVAPFVMDKDKEILVSRDVWHSSKQLWKRFRRVAKKLKPLMVFLAERGFEPPPIMFWPASAVRLWAQDVQWDELTTHIEADEGDLAMLMLRTADHLRQLLSLENEQPKLAQTARSALERLVRPPLV